MKKQAYIQNEQKRITDLVIKKFPDYYLTGGTALAFHFNHRFSEDLDFFSQNYEKNAPSKIMRYIKKETGFSYQLDTLQDDPTLIPMIVYFMELKKGCILKMDFVKDFSENIHEPNNGLHSVEDIYFRKICAAIGTKQKNSDTGQIVATGRQSVKDLFDLYYLSVKYKRLSKFAFEFFSNNEARRLDSWYRGFDRTELKLSLMDLVTKVDINRILKHMDNQICKEILSKWEQ